MLDSDIQVKTLKYDGPLSLLLLLIQKEEMDIRSLNITLITQQYLNYLNRMRELNFDLAGDYLYMAATLLYIKSENCLQEREKISQALLGEENPIGIASKAELIRRLEELQKFQNLGQNLWQLPKKGHEVFLKPKVDRKSIVNSILTPIDLNSLIMAMMEILGKEKRKFTIIKRDRLSIKEKLIFLKKYLKVGIPTNFFDILELDGKENENHRLENIVITFISLLELARLEKIKIFQNEDKQNIYIEVSSSLEDFNVELADSYEAEAENQELEVKPVHVLQ